MIFPPEWIDGHCYIHIYCQDDNVEQFIQLCEKAGYPIYKNLQYWIQEHRHREIWGYWHPEAQEVHGRSLKPVRNVYEFIDLISEEDQDENYQTLP